MPKLKTKRSAAKRFKVTGTGKLMKMNANKNHILTKKSPKRKRRLRKAVEVDVTNTKMMKRIHYINIILKVATQKGLEPSTSGVTGRHSNQLSY